MLSLMSFVAMRTIATHSGGDLGVPISAQGVAGPGPADDAAPVPAGKPEKAPPPPRVEDVPRATADALADGKVVVLLFAQGNAADDVATSRHFSTLSRLRGKVATFRAGISDVGKYAGIVAELGVSQAPSIVIVRPDLRAIPPIEGYIDSQYLLQRVRDQLK